jgi:hypothetical protein
MPSRRVRNTAGVLDVSLLGSPKVVKRYLRRLLRSKVPKDTQDGTDMCKQLGLDPKDVEAADRSVNGA